MMSSKSSRLLSYIERAYYARKKVCLIRPKIDTRDYFVRNETQWPVVDTYQIENFSDIISKKLDYDTICVDEGQFFDNIGIESHRLALMGKNVYIAAMNGDSDMKPWKNISELLPFVDEIEKINAVCCECGEDNLGTFSFYKGTKTGQVVIGDENSNYEALCRKCWYEQSQLV
jgi:thymidine kinase